MSKVILLTLKNAKDILILENHNEYNYLEINTVSFRFKTATPTDPDALITPTAPGYTGRVYLRLNQLNLLSNNYKNGIPLYYNYGTVNSLWVPNIKIKLTSKLTEVIEYSLVDENGNSLDFTYIDDIEILMSFIV